MADTRLYELEECVSPQADDILLIEESATQTDKKVKVSSLMPTDAVESAVADWLTAHPEATTTVEDGSITPAKLHEDTLAMFDEKANTTGEYDDMTVGSAKQLLSKSYTENKTPYIYRASVGGDRVYEKLIGGTIAWNQLVQNGNFADTSGWGSLNGTMSVSNNILTITRSSGSSASNEGVYHAGMKCVSGHKYIAMCDMKASATLTNYKYFSIANTQFEMQGGSLSNSWNKFYAVASLSSVVNAYFNVVVAGLSSYTSELVLNIKNCMLIDITQMFGTAIADYIYSLEQSTAGAGVAWFRALFPNDYYAYDSGSLQSVNVASKKVVGFNQIDESQIVNGSLNTATGEVQTNANRNVTGFIKINPNWNYYMNYLPTGNVSIYAFMYDKNQNYIGYNGTSLKNSQFTPKDLTNSLAGGGSFKSARYVRFRIDSASYTVGDACLNISNASKNGTYEPYEEHTYAFDSDITLRGIPKLDASNNLYYDGDVYESDGTVTRKYGIVDLGSLSWAYEPSGTSGVNFGVMRATLQNPKLLGDLLCTRYVGINTSTSYLRNDQMIISGTTAYPFLRVRDDAYTDATAFKAAMSGVYLVYELATPTTESADPYTNPQIVDADGTEEFVDYMQSQSTRDVAVPVGHESKYMINLRAKIEDATMLPTLPTANGTYTLKCIVASGTPTLSWVAD